MNNSTSFVTPTTFGMEIQLDLFGCNPDKIRSKVALKTFAGELCKVIDMKPFGEPWAERFGLGEDKTAGYSLVQLIETSCITGHFSEEWNAAYINIFSCKDYDPEVAATFTAEYFEADDYKQTLLVR